MTAESDRNPGSTAASNVVSKTAFYCCGVRMEDAERNFSLCNDQYAARFMDDDGRAIYAPFRSETMPNISNATRCRIIDDHVRNALAGDPNTRVISIGAGFDTRPYRLDGGHWIELDEPAVIGFKNDKLPISECRNPLERVAISFAGESLADKLQVAATDAPVLIVIEGVFMYLTPEQIGATLDALQQAFPRHELLCDLMRRKFFEKYGKSIHGKLVDLGASFTERPDHPEQMFLDRGYAEQAVTPMLRRALELGATKALAGIPDFAMKLMLSLLQRDMNGYAVHRLRLGPVKPISPRGC